MFTAISFAFTVIPVPAPTLKVIVSFTAWFTVKSPPFVRPLPAARVIVLLFTSSDVSLPSPPLTLNVEPLAAVRVSTLTALSSVTSPTVPVPELPEPPISTQ